MPFYSSQCNETPRPSRKSASVVRLMTGSHVYSKTSLHTAYILWLGMKKFVASGPEVKRFRLLRV